ncbi:60S ribosomal protein L18a [Lemmus lemmus]
MTGTITQCYQDMGAWHRAHAYSIQIMKAGETEEGKCCLLGHQAVPRHQDQVPVACSCCNSSTSLAPLPKGSTVSSRRRDTPPPPES